LAGESFFSSTFVGEFELEEVTVFVGEFELEEVTAEAELLPPPPPAADCLAAEWAGSGCCLGVAAEAVAAAAVDDEADKFVAVTETCEFSPRSTSVLSSVTLHSDVLIRPLLSSLWLLDDKLLL